MYKIAVCFYGFTRHARNIPDLERFFRPFFDNAPLEVSVYYATYDTPREFEDGSASVDEGEVAETLRKNNPRVTTVRVSARPYSESECLRHVKQAGAKGPFNSVAKVFLHREYSMYMCMRRSVELIQEPVDFVCVSRADWGIGQITTPHKVNIARVLDGKPGIVAGHLNGSVTKNYKLLSTDPRFMFGRSTDMAFVAELPALFLQHITDVRESNKVMHVHAFVSYALKHKIGVALHSHKIMFGVIKKLEVYVTANMTLNSCLEQRQRIQELFDQI